MAENPKFNNSGMFTNVNDTTHNDISVDNKSEVLATQGNVINSIKTFWNNLRAKLKYAVTRDNTSNAVGGNYQPVYVDTNGIVNTCNPTTIQGTVNNGNITLNSISNLYPGLTVCITVSATSSSSPLKIKNCSVYYPTGVAVKASDVSEGTYLFTYISGNGDKWILNNMINDVSTNSPGLMTAEEHTKLAGIAANANYFTYTLPTANSSELGGVKSVPTGDTANRDYNVQVNSDGTMKVNVPWQNTHNTAYLRAGINNNNENGTSTNGNTYLKIVDGSNTSKINISGSGNTSVTTDSNGNITISSQDTFTPTNISSTNKNPLGSYTVKGAGNNANTNYYLAGNGNWVRVISVPNPPTGIESEKTLKCKVDGTIYWG